MEISLLNLVFWGFSVLTLGAALGLALSKKLVHAAFLLFAVLFGVAALFVIAGAEFMAISQIIAYVGGILILLIFGVMLTQRDLLSQSIGDWRRLLSGILLSTGLGWLLWKAFGSVDYQALPWFDGSHTPRVNVKQIGIQTVTRFVLPFELISILLLIALVGASYLARSTERADPERVEDKSKGKPPH